MPNFSSYLLYTCDVVRHYSYFHIKIKINKNLSPMTELGIEVNIASFCLEVRVMFENFGSRWSFSWLGHKVNVAIAVALIGSGDFSPHRIWPNCHVISPW